MNFKKTWKRFFSLNRHHAEGFTLVELIVVIAILAILGGVAVPAYSGYVDKANMQADISLISEIEHALVLAYYNQDLTEGSAGFIMLSPNEDGSMADSEEGATALAMEKTFGSNWLDTMQLQYDNWGVSWNTVSYEDATNFVNSNFAQKYSSGELMSQVQVMTDAVNGLQMDATKKLVEMFDYGDGVTAGNAIDDVIEEYYGSDKKWEDFSATEKSNLLVLATASGINKGNESSATSLIPQYALYAAYAAENAEFNEAYKTFQNTINNVDPNSAESEYTQIKNAYNTLTSAADDAGFKEWQNEKGSEHEAAFKAVMTGVGNAMKDNSDAILSQSNDPNMFTTGIGNEMYNDYLNAAYATAGNEAMLEFVPGLLDGESYPGAVIVQYTVQNGALYITNSMPNS